MAIMTSVALVHSYLKRPLAFPTLTRLIVSSRTSEILRITYLKTDAGIRIQNMGFNNHLGAEEVGFKAKVEEHKD